MTACEVLRTQLPEAEFVEPTVSVLFSTYQCWSHLNSQPLTAVTQSAEHV